VFSTFAIKSLTRLPPAEDIATMQTINLVTLKSWFMVVLQCEPMDWLRRRLNGLGPGSHGNFVRLRAGFLKVDKEPTMTANRPLRILAAAVVLAAVALPCRAMNALHEAAATGDTEVVKTWIAKRRNLDRTYDEPSHGIEGNYARTNGITALMVAAQMGHIEVVKLLVEGGANLYAQSHWRDGSNPRSAFDYAVATGKITVVEYLWTKSDGVRFAAHLGTQISESCRQYCDDKFGSDTHSNLALFLIGVTRDDAVLGKGISEAACFSQTPLKLLAFLEKNAVRFPRNTLHCAAYQYTVRNIKSVQDRIAIASFFLDHGADPDDLAFKHFTPLMGAAAAPDLEMVKFLIARGANPNVQNPEGLTAIGAAANTCNHGASPAQLEPMQQPRLAMIEYLIRAGSDPKIYASGRARAQLRILTDCCSDKQQTATQRRICEVFGL
jgi:ankyrin repeat protein